MPQATSIPTPSPTHSLTHSLSHLTHALTHSSTHSLPLTHSLTPSLTPSLAHSPRLLPDLFAHGRGGGEGVEKILQRRLAQREFVLSVRRSSGDADDARTHATEDISRPNQVSFNAGGG